MNRRQFVSAAVGSAVAGAIGVEAAPQVKRAFDAIAFDGLVVFDPRPVAAAAEAAFPGNGAALVAAWRTRQFEYQWLRALGGRYVDFLQTTDAALTYAARQLGLGLDASTRQRLMAPYTAPNVWPDVAESLATLQRSGMRLVMLSNMTHAMMADGLTRAGVADRFDAILSTDAIATYKPDPRAYRLGVDTLRVPKERLLFAAFAGWDVAGAKWFGYPTFWVNRLAAPPEELGVAADGVGDGLGALVRFATEPGR